MSTTESRTGFRLPWSGDTHRDDAAQGDADVDATAASGVAAPETEPTHAEAAEPRATPAWPSADGGPGAKNSTKAPEPAEGAGVADTAEPARASGSADAAEPTPRPSESKAAAKVEGPHASAGAATGTVPTPVTPSPSKRPVNPLVAGLVRAMREAAEAARSETTSRVAAAATAQVEAIHALSSDEAAQLRTRADDEIVGIREWSKAEMARIREETERRIGERRERLTQEIDAHAATVERRIDAVRAAVSTFESKMETFFEELLREDDPARLATMAERMPEPPELEAIVASQASTSLDDADAAAAEAEAMAALDIEGDGPPDETSDDEAVARRLAGVASSAPAPANPDGPATTTAVTVVGLVSVASISVFKRSLAKLAGVRTVSVTSGPDGDFVFAVTHGPSTDLKNGIPTIAGFDARITAETEDGLAVLARDPEA